ncbi:MAG: hypothetical protein LBV03_05910 [Fusobacteriales bacterium]|jgi:hypothetical protein|nr:hypothetical protein [Fusobacteriales bacterium]
MKKFFLPYLFLSIISISSIENLEQSINNKILNDKILDEIYEFKVSSENIRRNYYIDKILRTKKNIENEEVLYNIYIEKTGKEIQKLKKETIPLNVQERIKILFKDSNIDITDLYKSYKVGEAIDKLYPSYKNKVTFEVEETNFLDHSIKMKVFLGLNTAEILLDLVNEKLLKDEKKMKYTETEKKALSELLKENKIKLFYVNAFEVELTNNPQITYEEVIEKIYENYVEEDENY